MAKGKAPGPRYAPLASPRTALAVPNQLRNLRLRHQPEGLWMTLEEVGKVVGLDSSTVSLHETAKRGISEQHIRSYSMLYKVPTWRIFVAAEATEAEHQQGQAQLRRVGLDGSEGSKEIAAAEHADPLANLRRKT